MWWKIVKPFLAGVAAGLALLFVVLLVLRRLA